MKILASAQPRSTRILSNVTSQVVKLLFTANQMIEVVGLPKASAATQCLVDTHSSVMLPRITLLEHPAGDWKRRQEVHVVRHDHEISQQITVAIETVKTFADNRG
jgi:hypothetical protein